MNLSSYRKLVTKVPEDVETNVFVNFSHHSLSSQFMYCKQIGTVELVFSPDPGFK